MSTLSELRAQVASDLRDPSHKTFLPDHVDALINAGIEEVSRIRPREVRESVAVTQGVSDYALPTLQSAWRVELWRDGRFRMLLPGISDDDESQSGWDLYAGTLSVPYGTADQMVTATDELLVWGYEDWPQLGSDSDVTGMGPSEEWGVRRFARASAFELMQADRATFAQWQGQSLNTDVSPNQLTQMVALYRAEWDRMRGHLRRLRRS